MYCWYSEGKDLIEKYEDQEGLQWCQVLKSQWSSTLDFKEKMQ